MATTPTVISKQRLAEFLFNKGIPSEYTEIPAMRLALPSKRWFFSSPVAAKIAAAIRRDIPKGYELGPSVCYHFTSIAANEFHRLHRISKDRPKGTDSAVAAFHYMPDRMMDKPADERIAHAIVCGICSPDAGVTLDLMFMEPQTRLEVDLTTAEIQRCAEIDFK